MSEWKEGTLAEIAEITMGQSPKGESCNQTGFGKPLLNGPTEFGIKYPTPVQYTEEPTKLSKKGDILFCVRGSTTGRMNWADQEYVLGRGLAAIRHIEGKDYQFFVKGVIDYNLPSLLASATGSTFPNVTRDQLANLEIFIPPPTEQKAIASVLSSLDDKIDLLHRQNKTLEAMAETLFRQWFVEEAEEDWEEMCLENIIEFNPSYKLSKENKTPYLEMSNVNTNSYCPIAWYDREFNSGVKFKNGDTLFARITPCLENGKTCFVDFLDNEATVGWGSTEFIVMKMKKPFHPFISYLIAKNEDFRDFTISCMTGSSGRQRAQANDIKRYSIRIPPDNIIAKLNRELSGFVKNLKNKSNQIRTLEKLRDTLLPKLMSGEVKVKC
ncbi:MAG: restriction endonuclease subunit S [Thermincola sp.]|jgi:type I restriction enzyme S subunit|nr:restriction endonuclease subunit S [Thermincola sp.]